MGGREGSRGYLIQAVIATLNSLKSDWYKVKIEPNTVEDKIDVIWLNNSEEIIEACQIKSSENNFGKVPSLDWIKDMIHDAPNAKKYRLSLIGNASGPTAKYFKNFKEIKKDELKDRYKILFDNRKNITIDLKPLDLNLLEEAILSNVFSFLNTKGINVDYETNKLISDGLIVQFLRFSTNGEFITKDEFENNLLNWIRFNYENQIELSVNQLSLKFYYSSYLDFTNELNEFFTFPDISSSDWIIEKKKAIQNCLQQIIDIEITKSDEPAEKDNSIFFGHSFLDQPKLILEKIPPSTQSQLIKLYQEIFDEDLSVDVFDFGNLKIPQVRAVNVFGVSSKPDYSGSDSEIAKRSKFDEFQTKLLDLSDILKFWEKLRNFRILPIILENNGQEFNEDIDIQIKLPKTIPLVQSDSFPILTRLNTLVEFKEMEVLDLILKHNKDSMVKDYYSSIPYPINMPIPNLDIMRSEEDKLSSEIDLFRRKVKHIYDYEIFYDNPEFLTIEINIQELKPNERISLPAYILINSNESFDINYEINTRTLKEKISEKLIVK